MMLNKETIKRDTLRISDVEYIKYLGMMGED